MTGVFSMKPNTRNVRDLDFEIKVCIISDLVQTHTILLQVDFNGELGSVSEPNTYRMR